MQQFINKFLPLRIIFRKSKKKTKFSITSYSQIPTARKRVFLLEAFIAQVTKVLSTFSKTSTSDTLYIILTYTG